MRRAAAQLAVLAGALAVWELVTVQLREPYFPPPSRFLPRVRELWFSGPPQHLFLTPEALDDVLPSLGKLAAGWALAALAGVLLGVALGRSRWLSEYADPVLQLGRAVPPTTLVPFFIVVFRLGPAMEIATIAFGVVWPVLLNSAEGARSIDVVQSDTARAFRLPPLRRLTGLILPAASPKIFAGLRLSVSIGLILMVIAEMMGGGTGIGERLVTVQRTFDIPLMWGVIILLGALGYLLNTAFLALENRALHWHTSERT